MSGTEARAMDGATDDRGTDDGAAADMAAGLPARAGDSPAPRARRAGGVLGVPIEVIVAVGRARPLVSELVTLRRDSVLALDSRIDDPVEIWIGDRLIARGELQEMEGEEGRLGVRLTEIEDLSHGV
jgi:flagellar motor switch protein FliN/FliY